MEIPVTRRVARRLPWIAAAALVIGLNAAAIGSRLLRPCPLNPWEPGYISLAWRAVHGPAAGAAPAAHMYGPAWTLALSLPLRLGAPPALAVPRVVVLGSALLLGVGVALALGRSAARAERRLPLVVPALLLAPSFPCASYYVEARPDMPAILLGAIAVWLLARGQAGRRRGPWALGLAFLALAGLVKQPLLAVAAVPLATALLRRSRLARDLSWVLPPFLVALLVVGALAASPEVRRHALEVPARFPLQPEVLLRAIVEGPARAPLPLALLLLDLLRRRAPRGEGEAWALGAMLVAWPVGTLTASKLGGEVNSHLPLLLAGAVWALLRLPSTGALAEGPGRARAGAPALLALLLLLGTAHDGRRMWWIAFDAAHGDASRPAVAAALRDLPGRVVGPDDPALVLEGGHAPGGCLAMELDADGWSGRLPPSVAREVDGAEWVVTVDGTWPRCELPERFLRARGFVPAPLPGAGPGYGLWRRER